MLDRLNKMVFPFHPVNPVNPVHSPLQCWTGFIGLTRWSLYFILSILSSSPHPPGRGGIPLSACRGHLPLNATGRAAAGSVTRLTARPVMLVGPWVGAAGAQSAWLRAL